jgi:hypothetical protein
VSGINLAVARVGARILRTPRWVLSDETIKDVKDICDIKTLAQAILEQGPPFSEHEVEILAEAVGDMDEDHNFSQDGHVWRDDILDKYAEHIQNYEYTYKPEAQDVDPSIDPEETHIGPMAQDIEKVNPAAVQETPEGVKTVDTGRLALMNAGAIASLARKVNELEGGGGNG